MPLLPRRAKLPPAHVAEIEARLYDAKRREAALHFGQAQTDAVWPPRPLRLVVTDGPPPPCPEAQRHTPAPSGFMAWYAWARRMARTHHQVHCPACGLFVVWVPGRPARGPLPPAGKLRDLLAAASAVVAAGHGNLNQPKYGARVEAFDALRDALEEYGQW